MSTNFIFDAPESVLFVQARQDFLRRLIPDLQQRLELETALDVGCGVGYFSKFLHEAGLRVSALDGRKENIEEAKRRVHDVEFLHADAEDAALPKLGSFDLVLCVGLLYHLENPFRAIRNLHDLTGKLLIIESMCVPEDSPMLYLLKEGKVEDQGLNYIAFYPSEGCLIKMLYQAGFPFVYRFHDLPDHEQFHVIPGRKRARTMLAASRSELDMPVFVLAKEPENPPDPWSTVPLGPPSVSERARFFLRRSWPEKLQAIRRLLTREAGTPRESENAPPR